MFVTYLCCLDLWVLFTRVVDSLTLIKREKGLEEDRIETKKMEKFDEIMPEIRFGSKIEIRMKYETRKIIYI